MSTVRFISDAQTYDVIFYLGEGGVVNMNAPKSIWADQEAMSLIRSQKPAIQEQLIKGFDCVRDGLTVAEVKTLTEAAQHGKNVSVVRLAA